MTFDIILVTWNRRLYTQATVASLISSGAYRDCERFIIVDNHSTEDGMMDFLDDMAHMKKVFIVRRPQNDGWGMAVNDVLGLSRAQYLFVSNNDVDYDLGFHQKMFKSFEEHPDIGILAVWHHTAHGAPTNAVNDEYFHEWDNVPAIGWMMPKKAMEKCGFLEENGPCFEKGGNGEDTSYAIKMKSWGYLVGTPATDVGHHRDGY